MARAFRAQHLRVSPKNWYRIATGAAAHIRLPAHKPPKSGAFPYTGAGIRTRDPRVMRRLDGGAVRHIWRCEAEPGQAGSARLGQIAAGVVPDRTGEESGEPG